mgnify:CR=1 FL=1
MKVVVGSKSKIKLQVVEQVFTKEFSESLIEVAGCHAESGVSDQPMGLEETKEGAKNRALHSKEQIPEADYWVGIEGGLVAVDSNLYCVAWMCIISKQEKMSLSHTASFLIPSEVAKKIKSGQELSDAANEVLGSESSNRDTIGILTDGEITRVEYYTQALTLALLPFARLHLYESR